MLCILKLMKLILTISLFIAIDGAEVLDPVQSPSLCEVCKFLTTDLKTRLQETGSKNIIETGHGLEKKKKIKYQTSELRFIEALQEPHVCDKILQYNIHKEKKGSLRFAKGQSETMKTLHGLVDKGVKVDLGIPHELWDKPSAEVTQLQRKCFQMVEDYEENLEEWYFHNQEQDLTEYLCANLVLNKDDRECLYETETVEGPKEDTSDKKGERKGESGKRSDNKEEL